MEDRGRGRGRGGEREERGGTIKWKEDVYEKKRGGSGRRGGRFSNRHKGKGRDRAWEKNDRNRHQHDEDINLSWRRKSHTDSSIAQKVDDKVSEKIKQEGEGEEEAMSTVGKCMHMCPLEEAEERSRCNELSVYEMDQSRIISSSSKEKFPFVVKKYRRAAAGSIKLNPKELRPPRILIKTLHHLLQVILPWENAGFDWNCMACITIEPEESSFLSLYHFLSDRLRSIRQDFVVQQIEDSMVIQCLEKIARFYILSSFQAHWILSSNTWNEWSEMLNDQQLVSALAQLRSLYQLTSSYEMNITNAAEFIAYEILVHANTSHMVNLILAQISTKVLNHSTVRRALQLFIAIQVQDFYQFRRLFEKCTVLEKSLLIIRHLPLLWQQTLGMMNKAFGKQDQFPLSDISKWLLLDILEKETCCSWSQKLCQGMNISVTIETKNTQVMDAWVEDMSSLTTPTRGYVNFKLSPIAEHCDQAVLHQVHRATVKQIFQLYIQQTCSAVELVVHKMS